MGWRVGLRVEDTADSKILLTLVNPPGLTVSSRSPKHKKIKAMGFFHTPALTILWSAIFLSPGPWTSGSQGLPRHLCGSLCESCWAAFTIWGTQDPSPNLLQLCLCKAEVIQSGTGGRPGLLCLCFIQMAGTVTHPASLSKPGHRPGAVVLIIDPDLKNMLTSLSKHPPVPQISALMGKGWRRMVTTMAWQGAC